ncbi:MAG TPA: hypothetical protein VJX92_17505 [Methylomirabilota bacterium]|nr:hypothetical protein [Methylomirabilota bacterium]
MTHREQALGPRAAGSDAALILTGAGAKGIAPAIRGGDVGGGAGG